MEKQSTGKGFAILSIASVLTKVLSLAYVPILTKIYAGDNVYGKYAIAYIVYVFIYTVATSGMPIGISKIVSEYFGRERYGDAYRVKTISGKIALIVGLILSIVLFLSAGFISKITSTPDAKIAIMTLSPTILITSLVSSYRGFFQGTGNMFPTAIASIIEQTINIIFSLTFAWILIKKSVPLGIMGGTIGTVLGALASLLLLRYMYKAYKNKNIRLIKNYKPRRSINHEIRNLLYRYTMPVTIAATISYGGMYLADAIMVKQRLNIAGIDKSTQNDYFAYLGKFNSITSVPLAFTLALSMAVLPAIAYAIINKNKKETLNKIYFANRMTLMITIPSAVGMAVLSKSIYVVLLGTRSDVANRLMMFGSAVLIFMALDQISSTILNSLGRFNDALTSTSIGVVIKIIFTYILVSIPSINILGALFSTMLCYLFTVNRNYRIISKVSKIKIKIIKLSLPYIMSAILMAIVIIVFKFGIIKIVGDTWIGNLFTLILSGIAGVAIYGISIVFLGGVSKKDLDEFPSKLSRIIPNFLIKKIR